MTWIVKCVLLCSLFVAAFCRSCSSDASCRRIRCAPTQTPACSLGQCFCRTGTLCAVNFTCRDACTRRQTYDCRLFRCHCGPLRG